MSLATRGNNKILRTFPPHSRSSEERLPRLTRRTLALLRTNKSPFLKSYLHKVDAKTHPSPICPLCNIYTHDTHHLFNFTHICTTLPPLDLWTDPAGVTALLARWTEKLYHWHGMCGPVYCLWYCEIKIATNQTLWDNWGWWVYKPIRSMLSNRRFYVELNGKKIDDAIRSVRSATTSRQESKHNIPDIESRACK